MKIKLHYFLMMLASLADVHPVEAQQTTAFTYQGQLRDGGTNASGLYTMIFTLYDAATNGNQIGSSITNTPALANGLFSANLDFGAGAFSGGARWLDINVEGDSLVPRVQVLPSPYALFATVAGTVANGAVSSPQLANNAVATANIQDAAVTNPKLANASVMDANIVSISAAKVSGTVALASNLSGTLPGDKLSGTYSNSMNFNNFLLNNFSGSFFGNGGGLSNLTGTVKTLNSLSNDVILAAGTNINVTTIGNTLRISAAPSVVINSSGGTTSIPNMQVFSTNGTFVVPTNVTKIMVEVWGGGGGGGMGGVGPLPPGGGGGGGGYAKGVFNVMAGTNYIVVVGAGGTPSDNGGDSSFGSLISATGGTAGGVGSTVDYSNGPGGVGGTGSGGQLSITGKSVYSESTFLGAPGFGVIGSGGLAGVGSLPSGGQGGPGLVIVYY